MGNATQPYRFTIDDTMTEPDAEPVAYKFWGMNQFTTRNYIDNVKRGNATRYDYVVTRHLKATYKEQDTYRLHNKAVVTAYPIDGIDDETTASASAEFLYKPVFIPPPGNYISRKAGNSNWWQIFKVMWQVADYGLDDLKDGTVDHLNSNIHFMLEGWAEPYPLTVISTAVGDELADIIESYAKRKVTMVLTDEDFYFNDGIYENSDRNIVISDTDVKIGYQDYSIDYVDYSIDMKDAVFDRMLFQFVPTNVTLTEEDVVTFYAKFRDSDEWVLAGTYNMFNGEKDYNTAYVKSITGGRIEFAENCVAYKMETRNCHYHTHMTASPYCRIKNSDYIMSQIEGKERVWLTNVSNYSVYDDDGHLEFSQDSHATDFIIGVVKDSVLKKEMIIRTDSTLKRNVSLRWRITMNEFFVANYGREDIPQETGTFYDLLPLGLDLDISTVGVFADGGFLSESDYEATQINNYNDTGRTMLRIYLKDQFQNVAITYETVYSWDDIFDYGKYLLNSVVYETGNKNITKGRGDDGGNIQDSSLLADIDPDTDDERFLYAERGYEVDTLLTVTTSLNKRVKGEQDSVYKKETKVNRDEPYKYKLRYATTPRSRAKDLILYDKLEGYKDDNIESQWKGSLLSVDTAQLRMQDAAPVVYCSLMQDVQIDENTTLDDMVDGERVWIPASQLADINDVTAIAVDIRKKRNGQDFVLEANKSIVVVLYMNSPMFDETNSPDPVACNNIYLDGTTIDEADNEEDYFIDYGYTTVHYRVTSSFGIIKTDSKEKDQPIKGISFTLQGVSDYGTSVNITRTTDKNGKLMFENIERGSYTFYETDGSDDYLPVTDIFNVEIDGYGNVTINDTAVDNRGYYYIEDDPRVHADIEFMKRDFARKSAPVIGAEFILTGTSNYGNSITRKIASDELGKAAFKNIEWGTYDLYEVNVPEGYIPNETAYTVTVDDSGFVSIRINTEKGAADEDTLSRSLNGLYYIYNEPYHSFNIQKLGQSYGMPVEGAVFAFEGTSDLGTSYHEEKTTPSSGRLSFSGLESGVYTLTEISAPEGYALDDTPHIVTITKDGSVTITGSELNSIGQFIITDKENSTITVTKIWEDNETNETREAVPVINLRTDLPTSEAYFDGGKYNSYLMSFDSESRYVKSFAPFDGEDSEFRVHIEDGSAGKVDDETTACSIYAWFDAETGAVVWWSDAKTVYLTDKAGNLWSGQLETIDVSGLDTSKMTDMSYLFSGLEHLKTLDLSTFDTSNVTSMLNMFWNCTSLTSVDLSSFDTSKVTEMSRDWTGWPYMEAGMFMNCSSLLELDLSSFDTSNVNGLHCMFKGCSSLQSVDVSSFDTSGIRAIDQMFYGCSSLTTIDVSSFYTDENTYAYGMFNRCTSLKTIYASDLWCADGLASGQVFNNDEQLVGGNGTEYDQSGSDYARIDRPGKKGYFTEKERSISDENAAYFSGSFNNYGRVSLLARLTEDIEDIKSFARFTGTKTEVQTLVNRGKAVRIDNRSTNYKIYAWFNEETGAVLWWSDAEKVFLTDTAKYLWRGLSGCTSIDVSGIDTSKMKNMSDLFADCSSLISLDLSSFDTSNVYTMESMFSECSSLTETELSSFDTSNVIKMNYMFYGCSALTSLDLSSFNIWNVTTMNNMFYNCEELVSVKMPSSYTGNVSSMDMMFSGCEKLAVLDLSAFDTRNVTSMYNMFANCPLLRTIYVSDLWSTDQVTGEYALFIDNTVLTGGNGTEFISENNDKTYARVDKDGEPGYFTYKKAEKKWTVFTSKDKNCELKKLTDTKWTYTFSELVPGLSFVTYEDELEGYTSDNMGPENAIAVIDGMAAIVNRAPDYDEPAYGSLKIKKTVEVIEGDVLTDADTARKFVFNVELKDDKGNSPVGTELFGTVIFRDGKATVRLASGESVTIPLRAGWTYKVTEKTVKGYECFSENAEGTIAADTESLANFKNIRTVTEADEVSFKVKKIVTGTYENDLGYRFNIVFTGLRENESYTITNGEGAEVSRFTSDRFGSAFAEFALHNEEEVNVNKIPAEATYVITEEAGDYISSFEITDENELDLIRQTKGANTVENKELSTARETADKGESVTVTFTNKRDVRQNVTLKKVVVNDTENDDDEDFTFDTELAGLAPEETIAISTAGRVKADEEGKISLKLPVSGGQTVVFYDLPAGATYKFTEQPSNYIASFRITDSNDQGKITDPSSANKEAGRALSTKVETVNESEDVTVTFTNKKSLVNITITKIWDDNKNNRTRTAKPVMHLKYEGYEYDPGDPVEPEDPPYTAAYFAGNPDSQWTSPLVKLTPNNSSSDIKSFAQFTGDDDAKQALIDSGAAVRIDDETTNYKIYGYFNPDNGAVRWWTDADKAFLTDNSHRIWYSLYNCTSIDTRGVDTSRVRDMSYMFAWCNNLTSLDLSEFDTSSATNMYYMLAGLYNLPSLDVSNFDTSNVTNMYEMFYDLDKVTSLDLRNFDTSNVTNMSYMFAYSNILKSIDVSSFDTAKVENFQSMFSGLEQLTQLDVSGFDTSSAIDMSSMFYDCRSLTKIDVSGFDTKNAKEMDWMFEECYAVTTLDVSGFDTSNVQYMQGMFDDCHAITSLDVKDFDTTNVTNMVSVK